MKNLYKALAAAIAAMPDPKKNSKNEHFKNSYADLGNVLECIEGPLASNGLLLVQMVDAVGPDAMLSTSLIHVETGEQLDSHYPLRPEKAGPQALGSCITYARRYQIKALFGMVDVDDDGEGAQNRSKPTAKPEPKKKTEPKTADGDWAEATMTPDKEPFKDAEHAITLIKSIGDQKTLDALKSRLNAQKTNLGKEWERVKGVYKEQGDIIAKGADYETIPFALLISAILSFSMWML